MWFKLSRAVALNGISPYVWRLEKDAKTLLYYLLAVDLVDPQCGIKATFYETPCW
jgi:hypothetical protein